MAIDIKQKNKGENFSFGIEETGKLGNVSWAVPFTATKAVSDTLLDVLAHADTPKVGDAHPDNAWLRVRNYTLTKSSPVFVEFTVNYLAKSSDPSSPAASDPTSAGSTISYSTVKTNEAIDEDINGDPIATANGEIINGVTKEISDLKITAKRAMFPFDPAVMYTYFNAVNSTTFHGFPAGTVKVDDIQSSLVTGDGNIYYDVTVAYLVRKPYRTTNARAWWQRVKHQGFIIKDGSSKVRALDDENKPVSQPVALKADGTKETDETVSHWKEFQVYDSMDLNSMGVL